MFKVSLYTEKLNNGEIVGVV